MYKKYCKLRDDRKLSDYQVAQATGIPKSTFSEGKGGRSKPGVTKIYKLARFFDVPMETFVEAK